jgi:hypothetical protein
VLTVLGFMVGGLLNFIAAGIGEIYQLLDLRPIGSLVYGQGTGSVLGPFAPAAWASIVRYTELFGAAAWLLLVAVAIVAGLWVSAHGDSRSWQRFSTIMWRMLFAGLLLPFNVLIAENLFALNNALVQTIAGMLPAGALQALSGVPTGGGIKNAFIAGLVHLMLQAETLFFNLLYLERMLVIAALVAIGPLAAWAWVWQQRGTAWGLWFSELTSNILMQSAHAIVIAVTWGLLATNTLPWWQYAVAIGFAIPIGSLLRRMITGFFELIGLREEAAAAGMMAGLAGSAKAIVGSGGRAAGGGTGGGGAAPSPSPDRGGGAPAGPGGTPVFGAGGLPGLPAGPEGMPRVFGGGEAARAEREPWQDAAPGVGPITDPVLPGRGLIFGPGGQVVSSAGRRVVPGGVAGTLMTSAQTPGAPGASAAPTAGGGQPRIHALERGTDAGGRWGRAIGGGLGKGIGVIAGAPVAVAFGKDAGAAAMDLGARAGRWVGERYGGGAGSVIGAATGAGFSFSKAQRGGVGWGEALRGMGGAALYHAFGYREGEFRRNQPLLNRRLKIDDMPRWRSHGGPGSPGAARGR